MRRTLAIVTGLVLVGVLGWLLVASSRSGGTPPPATSPPEAEVHEEDLSNIFVADIGSGQVEPLTANEGEDQFAGDPAWSPDGRSLLYAQVPCDDCEPYIELIDAGAAGAAPRRIGKGSHPSFFPDGRRFVFVGRVGGLYARSVDDRAVRELASARDSWSEPVTSPDGRRIAAVFQGSGSRSRLGILTLPEVRRQLLEAPGRSIVNPSWSPDGRLIAFAARDTDGQWRLYTVRPDGSRLRRLAGVGSDTEPTWSPDGSRIAFVRTDAAGSSLFVARASGKGARPLLGRSLPGNQPAWSPDGTRIAFVAKGDELSATG